MLFATRRKPLLCGLPLQPVWLQNGRHWLRTMAHLVVLLEVGLQGGDTGRVDVKHGVCAVHGGAEGLVAGQYLHKCL